MSVSQADEAALILFLFFEITFSYNPYFNAPDEAAADVGVRFGFRLFFSYGIGKVRPRRR